MFHKIKNVRPLADMVLHIEFKDGDIKHYDVKPLMNKWEVFKDLRENRLFDFVSVDIGGYGIFWNDHIDISCNELWEHGINLRKDSQQEDNVT